MTSSVECNTAQSPIGEWDHLILPHSAAEGNGIEEHDGRACAPVPIVQAGLIMCCKERHTKNLLWFEELSQTIRVACTCGDRSPRQQDVVVVRSGEPCASFPGCIIYVFDCTRKR